MSEFRNDAYETDSRIESRLKLKSVGGREVNVNSIPKLHPNAYHGIDQVKVAIACNDRDQHMERSWYR